MLEFKSQKVTPDLRVQIRKFEKDFLKLPGNGGITCATISTYWVAERNLHQFKQLLHSDKLDRYLVPTITPYSSRIGDGPLRSHKRRRF